ncbi:MAG TPA: tetratricopeptide repeat protein [Bryobacteraceae bacterium]|nr:tetratricopeptide repeat protein [Bryobacteraceae bacterium]
MKAIYLCTFCIGVASLAIGADAGRGIDLYRKNDLGGAVSALRQAVKANPDDARANAYLGMALAEQGKASEAEPFVQKANEIDSGGESKLALARLNIEKKDYDGAAAALADAQGEETAYVRGLLALNRKEYDAAAKDLDSFAQSHPDFAYAHYYAGLAYNGMKRPDKMLSHFEMFVRMKPDAPEAGKVRSILRTGR